MLSIINCLWLVLSSVTLIGLQNPIGFVFIVLGILSVLFLEKAQTRRDLCALFIAIGVLYFSDISTDISYYHMLSLGSVLIGLLIAFRFISKVEFKLDWPKWSHFHHKYLALVALIGGVLVPFYLKHSLAYLNWPVVFEAEEVLKLFIGTNFLGIWDELFFINVIFVLLRRKYTFWIANFTQAVIFTSFLFELGFTGWGPLAIYPFALIQGITYEKTKSLGFVIMIHLLLDFILFLSLLYWHAF